MKLVHVTFQEQYGDAVDRILRGLDLRTWVRFRRADGSDADGRHESSQAFPGAVTVVQVTVPDGGVGDLLDELEAFRIAKTAHLHLQALVLPVDGRIGPEVGEESGS